jgi:hypothetical protein
MSDFVLPVLGLGDEQSSPVTVTWLDGSVICRGILGSAFDPEPEQPDNVTYLCEWRHRRKCPSDDRL